MNEQRERLHEMLCGILESSNVYYQSPQNTQMKYPAIVYSREKIENRFANNGIYNQVHTFSVTIISQVPDCKAFETMSKLSICRFVSHYVTDNLNHYKFTMIIKEIDLPCQN